MVEFPVDFLLKEYSDILENSLVYFLAKDKAN